MHRRKITYMAVATLLLFLSLSGCAIGPDYRRPDVDSPASWRLEEKEAKDLANTTWWEQFNDPVMNDLIRDALKQNKDLRVAAERVVEYMGRYGVIQADRFPQFSLGSLGTRKGVSNYLTPPFPVTSDNPYNDFQAFMGGSWEIDIWGRIRRATEAARADLLSTVEARSAVMLTLVTAVAAGYTDLRHLDKQLDIAKRTAKGREESFELFKLRFDRGLISEVELNQVESEYKLAMATIPFIEKQVAQQENALSVLLGRNPGPIARGKDVNELVLPAVPSGLPSQLLERRPDIRQAEQELVAANARIGVARAAYFPVISLTGVAGFESSDLARLFTGPAGMWNYVVPASMTVFNAGATAGRVTAAESLQRQALLRYQQTIQRAFKEVDDALIDQRKSREQLVIQGEQVEVLRNYAELARLRYENGYTSYLEVHDAERSLFNAELAYTQTQGALFRALVNVYKSMGGGWVAQADKFTEGGQHGGTSFN
jgi:multidrug efflux system outer membrane protein